MLSQITICSPETSNSWNVSATSYSNGAIALTASDNGRLIPLTTQIPNLVLATDEICPKQWGEAKTYVEQLIAQGVLTPTKKAVSVGFATTEVMKLAESFVIQLNPLKLVKDMPQEQIVAQYEQMQQAIKKLATLADGGKQEVSHVHVLDFEQEMRSLSEFLVDELETKSAALSHTKDILDAVQHELDAERQNAVEAATVAKAQFTGISHMNSELSAKTNELTEDLAQATTTIVELERQLSDKEQIVTELSTKVVELTTRLNSAETLISELENKLNVKEQAVSAAMAMFQTAVKTLLGAEHNNDLVTLLGISSLPASSSGPDLSEALVLAENKLAETELALNVSKKLNEGLMAEYTRVKNEQELPKSVSYDEIPVLREVTSFREAPRHRHLEEVIG